MDRVDAASSVPITTYLDADLLAKYNDPAYFKATATQDWIPAVEQVLRNQKAILGNQATFASALEQVIGTQSADVTVLGKILADLATLIAALPPSPGPAVSGTMTIEEIDSMGKASGKMRVTFPDNLTAVATLALVDTLGIATTTVDSPPAWTADQAFFTITPAADGLSCTFKVLAGSGAVAGDVPIHAAVVAAGVAFTVSDVLTLTAGPAASGSVVFNVS